MNRIKNIEFVLITILFFLKMLVNHLLKILQTYIKIQHLNVINYQTVKKCVPHSFLTS